MSQELLVHILAGTAHVGEQGNAYFAGTAHVGEQVQTIQRSKLELHMWQKRVETRTGTAHVAKCFPKYAYYFFSYQYSITLTTASIWKSTLFILMNQNLTRHVQIKVKYKLKLILADFTFQ